jgi:hypothetical protein
MNLRSSIAVTAAMLVAHPTAAGSTPGFHFEDTVGRRSRPMAWSGTRAQLSFWRD